MDRGTSNLLGPSTTVANAWENFFFHGGTAERLGFMRIVLGIGLIPFHILQFAYLFSFQIDGARFFHSEPIWYFKLLNVEWHDPVMLWVVFVILIGSTVTFALGWYTRASLVVMLICIFYLKGMRDSVAGDVHHRYLIPVHVLLFFLLSR